jgi:flagellar biosynthesis anti-sigma factor FlgM
MDIRGGLDGLKSLLGVTQATQAGAQAGTQSVRSGTGAGETASVSRDRATLSSAGSEVAQSAADGGVRMDKVASIQAALSAGTYSVPASAVASRMVDAMLGAVQ